MMCKKRVRNFYDQIEKLYRFRVLLAVSPKKKEEEDCSEATSNYIGQRQQHP